MDKFIDTMKNSERAEGKDRIFIHGEKEFENEDRQKESVSISNKVIENLKEIGKDVGVEPGF